MATNHWVKNGTGGPWAAIGPMADVDIPIPAGATLRRFVCQDHSFTATMTGVGFDKVGNFYLLQRVWIPDGPYANHTLWQSVKPLRSEYAALYDIAVTERVYTQWLNAGDDTLLINEKTAFGTRVGPGFTLRYTLFSFAGPNFNGVFSYANLNYSLAALYETVP